MDKYKYRNRNTGDEVEYDQPSIRLDNLPNWDRIGAPSVQGENPEVYPVADPETEVKEAEPLKRAEVPDSEDRGLTDEVEPIVVPVPLRNASKDEWVEFAIAQGGDPAKVNKMKRDELIDMFGPKD